MPLRISGTDKAKARQRVQVGELVVGGTPQGTGAGAAVGTVVASSYQVYPLSIAFSGVQDSTEAPLWATPMVYTGSATVPASGFISPFQIYVGGDSVAADPSLIHFNVHAAASAGRSGRRTAIQGVLAVVGAPAGGEAGYAIGVAGVVRVAVNQGGTGADYDAHKGEIFAGNSNTFTSAAGTATFIKTFAAHEFDTTLASTASAADKYGISIVKGDADATRGSYDDAAIIIHDQNSAAVGWTIGLQFGGYAHKWAFATDSTLIGVKPRTTPTPATATALYGIDMSALTITAGGAGIVMPLITPASAAATGKAGSIVWDTGFIYVCTATNTWKKVAVSTW
jgi:hypothetical protein